MNPMREMPPAVRSRILHSHGEEIPCPSDSLSPLKENPTNSLLRDCPAFGHLAHCLQQILYCTGKVGMREEGGGLQPKVVPWRHYSAPWARTCEVPSTGSDYLVPPTTQRVTTVRRVAGPIT
jgi:hypothetical protein